MSYTPNINLMLTSEGDTTTTFKEWRVGINGENDDSNMSKIDKAIGDLTQTCSRLSAKIDDATLQTWKDVQAIVRSGLASMYFSIGDQFVVEKLSDVTANIGTSTGITSVTVDANTFVEGMGETRGGEYVFTFDNGSWYNKKGEAIELADYGITVTGTAKANDTVVITETTTELVFDVIGIDHDTPADENYTHSMTLQLHDLLADAMVYDAGEAIYYIDKTEHPSGLPAGTYTLQMSEDSGDTITFTTTKTIPVGGQIFYDIDYSDTVITYDSADSTSPLETLSTISGTGTNIGIGYDSVEGTVNDDYWRQWGSNRWTTSELRQWLNTNRDAGTWWVPQTNFDRPGTTAETDGFLNNMDAAFLDVVGDVVKTTQKGVADGYGLETSTERFFLLSRPEVYGGIERSADGADGTVYPYYGAGYSALSAPGTGSDKNRIKYRNGSAYHWWLRTPGADYGGGVRGVLGDGHLSSDNAYGSYGVAPACVIV